MRLLVIEDSPRLQESLKTGLTRSGFAVDVVGDGDRGLIFARRGVYDVIILDLMLPGMDGLEVLQRLRESGSEAQVLILTAKHSVAERVHGLELGADDYLPKPFAFDELVARVHALVRRTYASKGRSIEIGDLTLDTVGRRVERAGVEIDLTRREYRVLEYLAHRKGETVTRIEIEDHIYNENRLPGSNAIESAISVIRKKLKHANGDGGDLIHTRHGIGYCLDDRSA